MEQGNIITWELVYKSGIGVYGHYKETWRARVEGGFLYRHTEWDNSDGTSTNVTESMCFVPVEFTRG